MTLLRSLLLLLILPFMLTACLDEEFGQVESGAYYANEMMMADAQFAPTNAAQGLSRAKSAHMSPSSMALDRTKFKGRRIAENHGINVETEQVDLQKRFQRDFRKCIDLGCEVVNSNVNRRRSAHLNVRIDPEKLPEFLDHLATGPGSIKSHQVNAEDKTYQYIDTSAKLKNQEALRDRLHRLLESDKAKKVNEILEIERELTRVQSQIDSYNTQKRFLERVTNMATVNVSYSVPYQALEFNYHDLRHSLRHGWQSLISNTADMVQFVGAIVPWVPVFFIGLWLVVRIFRLAFRGTLKAGKAALGRNKKEKKTSSDPLLSTDDGTPSPFVEDADPFAKFQDELDNDKKKD